MKTAVIVIWKPDSSNVDELQEILLQMRGPSLAEPGCLKYDVHRADDGRIVLYEQYVDAAAIEAHHATDHYQELVVGRALKLNIDREITRATLLR
jgi:quinol monooxygenase YgiN